MAVSYPDTYLKRTKMFGLPYILITNGMCSYPVPGYVVRSNLKGYIDRRFETFGTNMGHVDFESLESEAEKLLRQETI